MPKALNFQANPNNLRLGLGLLHPTVDTRKKLDLLHDFGKQGSPISTKKF